MRLVTTLFVLTCGLLACSGSSDDSPPGITDCQGSGCVGPGSSSSAGGSAGSSGQGGAAGASGQAGQGGEVSIKGLVQQITDTAFTQKTLFLDGAAVSAKQAGKDAATATALQDGAFSLDHVFVGEGWLRARASNDGQLTLGGYRVITTKASGNPDFEAYVVDRQVLVAILAALPTPAVLSDSAAHAVVDFVDAQGLPVSGVTATANNLTAPVIVGDNGPDYGDNPTSVRGKILVLNFTATTSAELVVTFPSDPTSPVTIPLPNEAATVTFMTVRVP